MNDVVERVARKLCEQHGGDPDAVASEPHDCWDGPLWTAFISDARAAIEAMRTPTRAMKVAGGLAFNPDTDVTVVTSFEAGQAWISMIDAALADASPDIGKEGKPL